MSSSKAAPKTTPSGLSKEAHEAIKREMVFGNAGGSSRRDTRFQKGQSGNPRGRPPRRSLNEHEAAELPTVQAALHEGRRLLTIREGDTSKQITTIEAAIRKQVQLGLNGNPYSLEKALQRLEQADRIKALQVAADHERWQRYCDDALQKIADAKEAGQPEPLILPHPDDVIFVPGELVQLRPPLNQEQHTMILGHRRLCELLILQDAWDERSIDVIRRRKRSAADRSAMLASLHLNRLIPPRFRLSDAQMIGQSARAMGIPKRDLQKQLFQGWRALGCKVERGRHFPPYASFAPAIKRCFVVAAAMTNDALDPAAMARGEFNEAARAFFEEHGVPID